MGFGTSGGLPGDVLCVSDEVVEGAVDFRSGYVFD